MTETMKIRVLSEQKPKRKADRTTVMSCCGINSDSKLCIISAPDSEFHVEIGKYIIIKNFRLYTNGSDIHLCDGGHQGFLYVH